MPSIEGLLVYAIKKLKRNYMYTRVEQKPFSIWQDVAMYDDHETVVDRRQLSNVARLTKII